MSSIPETLDELWITINGVNYFLRDVRAALAVHGLDITTEDAIAWGIHSPIQAGHIDRICELQQQVDALEAGYDIPEPNPKKEAAE